MINRLPHWFRQDIPDTITLERTRIVSEFNIHTVCQEAKCPNFGYCFKNSRLTFIILGDTCTRNCRFCAVNKRNGENSLGLDSDEPYRISQIVKRLSIKYVVITAVSRDDLCDGGAAQFAKTIGLIRVLNKNIKIELLIPDFQGRISSLRTVLDAGPDLVAHNIETISRLYKDLRPAANYQGSLDILKKIKELKPSLISKSSLMLGLGETEEEVKQTLEDLRKSECDILTLGQYLAPSKEHYPVKEFIDMEQFERYREIGLSLGFKAVLSGPLVRSSYRAEEVYKTCMISS
jgi:lipoic acid synthetase